MMWHDPKLNKHQQTIVQGLNPIRRIEFTKLNQSARLAAIAGMHYANVYAADGMCAIRYEALKKNLKLLVKTLQVLESKKEWPLDFDLTDFKQVIAWANERIKADSYVTFPDDITHPKSIIEYLTCEIGTLKGQLNSMEIELSNNRYHLAALKRGKHKLYPFDHTIGDNRRVFEEWS